MSQPEPHPKPTLSTLPYPTTNPDHYIHIISNLLTPAECTSIIEKHQTLTPSNVTPDTVRTRQVFEDVELAARVWGRLREFYGANGGDSDGGEDRGRVVDEDGEAWLATGLNEVWRLCCYEEGGKFSPHQDGRRLANINSQSFMTVNIYLNSIPASNGGSTRFLPTPPHFPINPSQVMAKAQPIMGSAAVFRDSLWHDGEEVRGKDVKKYLVRTDVMFERERAFEEERVWGGLGKEERARRCLGVAAGLEDAGVGGEAVGWYRRAFRLWPALEGEV